MRGRFFNGVHTAHRFEVDGFERLAGNLFNRVTQRRFHNAAGRAEYNAAAGRESERHVERFRFQLVELNAKGANHALDFARGNDDIGLGNAVDLEFRQLCFELLRRARHNGDDDKVFAFASELFRQDILRNGSKHSLRRAAGGNVRQHLGIVRLAVLDPRRAAARKERQLFLLCESLNELGRFFEDRHVGGKAGVVNVLKAHELERGD